MFSATPLSTLCSKTPEERWAFYFRYIHTLEMDPKEETDPALRVLLNQALMANFAFEDYEAYVAEMNETWVRNAEHKAAVEDGLEQGKEIGKHKVAKAMKDKGYPIEEIAELTGLSREKIEEL